MARGCEVPRPDCPLYQASGQCFTDTHHMFYPRRDYTETVEKLFRELPENKVELRRCDHNELHATQEIPEKPPVEEMRHSIAQAFGRGAIYLSVNNQKAIE